MKYEIFYKSMKNMADFKKKNTFLDTKFITWPARSNVAP